MKPTVLVAGATGYLGGHVTQQLLDNGYRVKIITRNTAKVSLSHPNLTVIEAHATQPETLQGIFDGVQVLISTIGRTRGQKHLSYMDVDFQANANLIDEAKKAQVKKVVYVSVLKGDVLTSLSLCHAKEKLVDYLKASGMNYAIIRPNGFFSDMDAFLNMAKKGKIYLLGSGEQTMNPIHGGDLAYFMMSKIEGEELLDNGEFDVGGPDLMTHNEIAKLAFDALGKPANIMHLPDVLRKLALKVMTISNKESTKLFFMHTLGMDMNAPKYGKHHLADFFEAQTMKM